jgi:hypothetical protein
MKLDYQKICKDFINSLPSKAGEVLERRFGLKSGERETLESIGSSYGITRERVRQIEAAGVSQLKKKIQEEQKIFQHFKKVLNSFGGAKEEKKLLERLAGNQFQNQAFFLLNLSDDFQRIPEDNLFHSFWTEKETGKQAVAQLKNTLKITLNRFNKEKKTFSLKELLTGQAVPEKIFLSCLEISKEIEKNPEGRYGLKGWLEINPHGLKDKAYLVLKKKEQPLHFKKIAGLIEKLPFPCFQPVQTATVHNELIKDPRFVLVGRGLYALREWGYQPGLVKDVIYRTLKEAEKPLTREEILEKVQEQRLVKANTIALNLQNKDWFFKDEKGRYSVKEA